MPKVTDAHLAARRQQILDAARACFLRKGFHATSMQEVIAEAGLSVGAVYRYFPSKNDLVMAIAEQALEQLDPVVATAAQPGVPLAEALGRLVDVVSSNLGPDGVLRLAVQVWSEALLDPTLGRYVAGLYERLRARLVTLAEAAQRSGELPADADPRAVGAVLFALLPGYGLQRLLAGSPEPEVFKAGIGALLAAQCAVPATHSTDHT